MPRTTGEFAKFDGTTIAGRSESENLVCMDEPTATVTRYQLTDSFGKSEGASTITSFRTPTLSLGKGANAITHHKTTARNNYIGPIIKLYRDAE